MICIDLPISSSLDAGSDSVNMVSDLSIDTSTFYPNIQLKLSKTHHAVEHWEHFVGDYLPCKKHASVRSFVSKSNAPYMYIYTLIYYILY